MIYHRTDETGFLLQTDLRLVPCDVDGYYLVQGLEAQFVFQVGSFRARGGGGGGTAIYGRYRYVPL